MKERIDVLLVQQGFCETREKAKRHLMAGLVFVEGQRIEKPGTLVLNTSAIEVKGVAIPFVSRGGLKLDKAIKTFGVPLAESVCMDIGASTGGFTDCMLQHAAKRVYAVDVGYGQLDWKLRQDSRVVNLERTNIRYITAEQVPEKIDFFSVDVAFISLKLVLPAVIPFLSDAATGVLLIKPQFEAGREKVGKGGVVRDPSVHRQVIQDCLDFLDSIHLSLFALDFSPITGPNGNIEFLAYVGNCSRSEESAGLRAIDTLEFPQLAEEIVARAHASLK